MATTNVSTNNLDTTQFNDSRSDSELTHDTNVIKLLKSKQAEPSTIPLTDQPAVQPSADPQPTPNKSTRGRKKIYLTDEARKAARRVQQKAYRERKKQELIELRALKANIEQKQST